MEILANCPLTQESVETLQETATSLRNHVDGGCRKAFMCDRDLFEFRALPFGLSGDLEKDDEQENV